MGGGILSTLTLVLYSGVGGECSMEKEKWRGFWYQNTVQSHALQEYLYDGNKA